MFCEIFLEFSEIQNFDNIILNFVFVISHNLRKISPNTKLKILQKFHSHPMQEWSEGGRGMGQYSLGASSALTQIVPYSSSLYTVFHSVIYNSVVLTKYIICYARIIDRHTHRNKKVELDPLQNTAIILRI